MVEGIGWCLCCSPTCVRQAVRTGAGSPCAAVQECAGDAAAAMVEFLEQGPGLRAWSWWRLQEHR